MSTNTDKERGRHHCLTTNNENLDAGAHDSARWMQDNHVDGKIGKNCIQIKLDDKWNS